MQRGVAICKCKTSEDPQRISSLLESTRRDRVRSWMKFWEQIIIAELLCATAHDIV